MFYHTLGWYQSCFSISPQNSENYVFMPSLLSPAACYTQTSRAQDVGSTLKPPSDIWTAAGVAKMLIKDSNKISSKDLKQGWQERLLMCSSHLPLQCPNSDPHINIALLNPFSPCTTPLLLYHVKPCPVAAARAPLACKADSWGRPSSWRRSSGTSRRSRPSTSNGKSTY